LFLLVAFVAMWWWAGGPGLFGPAPNDRGPFAVSGAPYRQSLQGATATRVRLNHGAGRLALTGGAGNGLAAEGTLPAGADTDFRVRDQVGYLNVDLGERGRRWPFWGDRDARDVQLRLSSDIPIQRLEVRTGAAEADLDLRELPVADVDVQVGATSLALQLPGRGVVDARIQGGASRMDVTIPSSVPASIRVEGGMSQVRVDPRFVQQTTAGVPGLGYQAEYRSPGFEGAPNRVTLRIQAGASSVTVS
jgi:hypothetical protein